MPDTISTLLAPCCLLCFTLVSHCHVFFPSTVSLFYDEPYAREHTHTYPFAHSSSLSHSCPITANTCQTGATMTPTKTGQKTEQDAWREEGGGRADWRNDDPDLAKSLWVSKAALDFSACGLADICKCSCRPLPGTKPAWCIFKGVLRLR